MNSRYRLPFSIHFRSSYMIYFIYRQHSFLSRKHMNPQLTRSRRQWLHSSVGRASHRYRDVTGSNSVEVLNFFPASLRNCINCVHCYDHFFIFVSFPQFIYDLFHISLTRTCITFESTSMLPTSPVCGSLHCLRRASKVRFALSTVPADTYSET